MRYIARAIEERGTAAVIVLSKWDAVPNKARRGSTAPVRMERMGMEEGMEEVCDLDGPWKEVG